MRVFPDELNQAVLQQRFLQLGEAFGQTFAQVREILQETVRGATLSFEQFARPLYVAWPTNTEGNYDFCVDCTKLFCLQEGCPCQLN